MSEIRNLTRNGETFYPLTHEKAVIGMEEFKETITNQVDQYKPIEITGNVTNAPDEEDITSDSNNLLKFKNRNNLYGLGKVILRRGSSFASQVTLQNTIYVIQYNFDLGNARINIPNGSILLFEGGSLSNGTLVCADQYDVRLVYYQDISVILSSITLEGNFIHKACDKDTIREILVDNSSITKDANDVLSVKANGIQNSHLNSNTVDDSSIALDSNNKISIKDGGITGAKLNSGIVNTDDLSIVNNKIQLSNRGTTDGMGKIILRKDQSFASQLTQQNTIYVIRYNFTLTGNVTIPVNCVLEFDGGSITGAYTLTGNNTGINADLVKIFNTNVTLAGTWDVAEAYPEWFGAKGDGITDDSEPIEKAVEFSNSDRSIYVVLKRIYYIGRSISVYKSLNLRGYHNQDRNYDNPSQILPGTESCIYVANNITAFNLIGIPKEEASRFVTMYVYGIKVVGKSGSRTETFIEINAFGYPSRFSVIKDCEFAGLDKVIHYNIAGHQDTIGFGQSGLNVEHVLCYFSNHFIYALDPTGLKPSLANLHVKDSSFENMYDAAFKIYELFGSNIIEGSQFESLPTCFDVSLMDEATIAIESNYIVQITSENHLCINVRTARDGVYDYGTHYVSLFNNLISPELTASFYGVNIVNGQDLNKFNKCSLSRCLIDSKYTDIPLDWIDNIILVTGKYTKPSVVHQIVTEVPAYPADPFPVKRNGFKGRIFDNVRDNGKSTLTLTTALNPTKENFVAFYKGNNIIMAGVTGYGVGGWIYDYCTKQEGVVIVRCKEFSGATNLLEVWTYGYTNGIDSAGTVYASQASVFLDMEGYSISDISASKIGDEQFDESNNKPIYWTGSAWVDATGTPV